MNFLRKRYDMIALFLQAMPQVYHNPAQPIITLNLPKAIITAHPLYAGYATGVGFVF